MIGFSDRRFNEQNKNERVEMLSCTLLERIIWHAYQRDTRRNFSISIFMISKGEVFTSIHGK